MNKNEDEDNMNQKEDEENMKMKEHWLLELAVLCVPSQSFLSITSLDNS